MGRELMTGTLADNVALPSILVALIIIVAVVYLLAFVVGRAFKRGRG